MSYGNDMLEKAMKRVRLEGLHLKFCFTKQETDSLYFGCTVDDVQSIMDDVQSHRAAVLKPNVI